MRVQILMGSAILCLGMFGATTAMAAGAAGTLGGTTCGDFIKMDATAQASLVTDAAKSDSSLTSNSGTTNNGAAAGTTKPATPLTAGQLVAACQAAAPTSTVLDAFSAANGATSPAPAAK